MDSVTGYFFLVVVLFVSSWLYPAMAIGGILCLYGLDQWAASSSTFFVGKEYLTNVLFGCSVLLANIKLLYKHGLPIMFYTKVGWLVILMYTYVLISINWSPSIAAGMSQWNISLPYIITFVILVPLLLRNLSDIHQALSFLVIFGGILIVLVLFYTDWEGRGIIVYDEYGYETTANPLAISQMAGYVALACAFGRQWDSKLWDKAKWILFATCSVLIVKTGSRGQLISLLMIIFFMWPLSYKVKSISNFLLSGFVIALISYLVEWALQEYWSEGSRWESDTMSEDMDERFSIAKQLISSWWNGGPSTLLLGLGNSAAFSKNVTDWGYYPHIVVLEIIGEEGLIGISIYSLILYTLGKLFLESYKLTDGFTRVQGSLIALSSMLLYDFILSFKQGSFLGLTGLSMFYVLVGKYAYIILSQHSSLSMININNSKNYRA